MSINKSKKVAAASALAAMFAGGASLSAVNLKDTFLGAGLSAIGLLGSDVLLNKSLGGFIKEKANAQNGLWNKYFNKGEKPADSTK